jgi:hypothetical protein
VFTRDAFRSFVWTFLEAHRDGAGPDSAFVEILHRADALPIPAGAAIEYARETGLKPEEARQALAWLHSYLAEYDDWPEFSFGETPGAVPGGHLSQEVRRVIWHLYCVRAWGD